MNGPLPPEINRMVLRHMDNTGMDGYAATADLIMTCRKLMEGLVPIVNQWVEQMASVARAFVSAFQPVLDSLPPREVVRLSQRLSGPGKGIQ